MIKINISLNGVKVTRQIPTKWEEINFGEFMRLSEAGEDFSKQLAIFTGVDADTLKKAVIENLDKVRQLLSFIQNGDFDLSKPPKKILGHTMPDNLAIETIGQYEDLKAEAAQNKGLASYPMYCAIYATNPYDYEKAEKLAQEFLNAPALEVLALGNFTLAKLIESKDPLTAEALKTVLRTKKKKPVLNGWLSRLAFTVRFYLWKRKHLTAGMNS